MNDLSYQLSDHDIKKIIKHPCKIMTYPELSRFKTIEAAFGRVPLIVLLYINDIDGGDISGHWVLLSRNKVNGVDRVEYLDSYSGLSDEPLLKWYDGNHKQSTGQDVNFLSRLLYTFSKKKNCEVHYLEKPLQKLSADIATCGRFVAVRGRFYRIPIEDFERVFLKLKKQGYNLDELITEYTSYLI